MKAVVILPILCSLYMLVHGYGSDVGRIVQITDPHVDKLYQPGAFSSCKNLECCRADSYVYKHDPNLFAGPQGDYLCSPPVWTLDAGLEFAASIVEGHEDTTVVMYSGDSPQKDFFSITQADILGYLDLLGQGLAHHIPDETPVLPIIGNHDCYPIDQLPLPPESDWLFEGTAKSWGKWLGKYPGAMETWKKGGYYSFDMFGGKLRFLNLNSMWYDPFNMYVDMNITGADPTGQWAWLIDNLDAARADGAKAIVHAHIPTTAAETTSKSSDQWAKMAADYSDVVVGHIMGHVHNDMTTLFTNDDGDVVGAEYKAPSITPCCSEAFSSGLNPSVRVFYVNLTTFELVDFDQFRCDLVVANMKNQTCVFDLAYRFSQRYNVPTPLNPTNLAIFRDNMNTNDALLQLFYDAYTTGHPTEKQCVAGPCRKEMLCTIMNARKSHLLKCQGRPFEPEHEREREHWPLSD